MTASSDSIAALQPSLSRFGPAACVCCLLCCLPLRACIQGPIPFQTEGLERLLTAGGGLIAALAEAEGHASGRAATALEQRSGLMGPAAQAAQLSVLACLEKMVPCTTGLAAALPEQGVAEIVAVGPKGRFVRCQEVRTRKHTAPGATKPAAHTGAGLFAVCDALLAAQFPHGRGGLQQELCVALGMVQGTQPPLLVLLAQPVAGAAGAGAGAEAAREAAQAAAREAAGAALAKVPAAVGGLELYKL